MEKIKIFVYLSAHITCPHVPPMRVEMPGTSTCVGTLQVGMPWRSTRVGMHCHVPARTCGLQGPLILLYNIYIYNRVGSTTRSDQRLETTGPSWELNESGWPEAIRFGLTSNLTYLTEPVRLGRFRHTDSFRFSWPSPPYYGSAQVCFTSRIGSYTFQRPGYAVQIVDFSHLNSWIGASSKFKLLIFNLMV